jgi:hypothetical protein
MIVQTFNDLANLLVDNGKGLEVVWEMYEMVMNGTLLQIFNQNVKMITPRTMD